MGAILLVAAALLAFSLLSASRERATTDEAIGDGNARGAQIEALHQALLRSAVRLRNTGLQAEVEAVNSAEKAAVQSRGVYLGQRKQIEDGGPSDSAKPQFSELAALASNATVTVATRWRWPSSSTASRRWRSSTRGPTR